jgi:hypothetical protein
MRSEASPVDLPIRLERNGSWSRTLFFRDELDQPVDLTGVTFSGSVRSNAGSSTSIAALTFSTTDAPGGQVLVSLVGSALDSVDEKQEAVRLAHDAYAKKGGVPTVIFRGTLILDPEVTP